MGTDHNRKPSEHNGASPDPQLGEDEMAALRRRLALTEDEEKILDGLEPKERESWYLVARNWNAPESRLVAIDAKIKSQQHPVPAFHVPTAEGVATYRGLFGGNGGLSPGQKKRMKSLLKQAIKAQPEQPPADTDEP